MARYIAVIHGWFVDSNGFNTHELSATNREEAEKQAVYIRHLRDSTFDKCAHVVIEIADNEHQVKPRKLTLIERITGRIQP